MSVLMGSVTLGTAAWLRHVPVAIFASVMGITSVGLCWRGAAEVFGLPAVIGEILVGLGVVDFVLAAALYGAKALRYPELVLAEARHPVRGGFLGTLSIAVLLVAKGLTPVSGTLAMILVAIAMTGNLLLTLFLFARWTTVEHAPEHVAPTWLIPAIANLLVPFVGLAAHSPELGWFCFATGLGGWLLLLPLVLGRLFYRAALPEKLRPTIYALIAPPAVAFLSYSSLTGSVDGVARILFYLALTSGLGMLGVAGWLARSPFALSWWAFTMPSAAVILAMLRYGMLTQNPFTLLLALVALPAVSAVLAVVAYLTVMQAARGGLFVAE